MSLLHQQIDLLDSKYLKLKILTILLVSELLLRIQSKDPTGLISIYKP